MVAIGRVVLTSREHIIALELLEKGLIGALLRYPYEVRSEEEYFDEIQDVKVTKDMLDLAHRQPKVGAVRAGEVRGPLESGAGRTNQPEARRQADHSEGAAERRERRRPDAGAAAERRRRPSRRRPRNQRM
jgi:DNA end-binding protein Ku